MENNVDDDGWIRPLGKFEALLEIMHQQGYMISSYYLVLNSKNPLEEKHLKKSLLHLLRKVPSLNVCIRTKEENEMWFHKMETENVDFKILENVNDIHHEFEALSRHHYNSFDGPLWCARLIPQPLDSSCAMPEIKLLNPHQYVLLLGFHHSITDGTSNIKICNELLGLLNNVIAGDSVDDLESIGDFVSTAKTEKLLFAMISELMSNPEELNRFKENLTGGVNDMLFLKAFPPPNDTQQTSSLSYALSKEETSSFLQRCKLEGVTIHTGFCSLINSALAEMLKNAGVEKETYKIKSYHTINNRRYWSEDTSRALGAHLGLVSITDNVNALSNAKDFWNRTKTFHSIFNLLLRDKIPLKESAVKFMTSQGQPAHASEGNASFHSFYYGTTNMGNMSTIFTGEGDHVQVTDFKRTTATVGNLCSHVMQTFRGRFIYCLDYEKQLMSCETAQLYVDTIFKVLREMIKT